MKEFEALKDLFLCELDRMGKKSELTPVDADVAKKALEVLEMIEDICDRYEEKEYDEELSRRYSMSRYPMSRCGTRSYAAMPEMDRHYSERRGRSATTGRYVSRGNEGTVDHMIHKLEDMKHDAPDEETLKAIDNVINKLEAY